MEKYCFFCNRHIREIGRLYKLPHGRRICMECRFLNGMYRSIFDGNSRILPRINEFRKIRGEPPLELKDYGSKLLRRE